MRSKMLDEQIAMKGKMNNILSAQQYEKQKRSNKKKTLGINREFFYSKKF
jgi:hypothetical protein